jgi:hypothetical protein
MAQQSLMREGCIANSGRGGRVLYTFDEFEDSSRSATALRSIERRENIVIIGNREPARRTLRWRSDTQPVFRESAFSLTTASALVTELINSHQNRRLGRFYRKLGRLDLLIIDEAGYMRFPEQPTNG